jgi:hypothetical protein
LGFAADRSVAEDAPLHRLIGESGPIAPHIFFGEDRERARYKIAGIGHGRA